MTDWRKRESCPEEHAEKLHGLWRRGTNNSLGVVVQSNGRPIWKLVCRYCGQTSSALPVALVVGAWGFAEHDIEWQRENDPYDAHPPCERLGCTAAVTEYHHFAPYNTFPMEADQWPTAYLCREHHIEWHRRMDGYRWHRRTAQAS